MSLGSRQEQLCYIKIFIQDLRVCGRIENIDKIFVLCSFSSRSLYSCHPLVSRPPVRSERMVPTIHPSERTVVSRSSRDQRDTRPRMTRVTLTRDVFIISYPLFVVNLHSRIYNRRFNFIKIFFSLNKHALCLAYRVIKVSRKFIPLHRKKTLLPLAPVP